MISPRAYRLIGMYSVSTDGHSWYDDQREGPLGRIANRYGMPYRRVAAMFSVLSPNISWRMCYAATERLLMQDGLDFAEIRGVVGYKRNVSKAYRIMHGEEPDKVVSGPKVTAFYRALLGDDVLVIDAHVINAWRGELEGVSSGRLNLNQTERRELTRDYHDAARAVGCDSIRAFQARVWNEQRKQRDMKRNPDQLTIMEWTA